MMDTFETDHPTDPEVFLNGCSNEMPSESSCSSNGNLYRSIESGIDETEFKTNREESEKIFARQNLQYKMGSLTFEDLFNNLNVKKTTRADLVSQVELDPNTKRFFLKEDKSNIRQRYGFDDSARKPYLYPEEALYLLEGGKIEILYKHVSLSVQRARSILLVPNRKNGDDPLASCTNEEYFVYKYLTAAGYCVYRHGANVEAHNESTANDAMTSVGETDVDTEMEDWSADVIEIGNQRKGQKRKCPSSYDSENEDLMDDVDDVTLENSRNPYTTENAFHSSATGYRVDEADSDVEIVDEVVVTHGGVEIQEISHSVGYFEEASNEPTPSTSRGPDNSQVVVDLVSSEDEDEEICEFAKRVWFKLVPNSKVILKFPPSALIPNSVPISDKVYDIDLKDKSDNSDLELECLVDEVSLNDELPSKCSALVKSWKEWRQNMFQEARDAINDSLLSGTEYINGDSAAKKLCLWKECNNTNCANHPTANSNVVFKMYGISAGFSRQKASLENPLYFVSIVKQDEKVPEFGVIPSSIDHVPNLIAVVSKNADEVIFMTSDNSQLDSLFSDSLG